MIKKILAFMLALSILFPTVRAENKKTRSFTLSLGGDCVLGNDKGQAGHEKSFDSIVNKNGLDWPFSKIRHIFEGDDFTLLNLECVLQDNEEGFKKRQHNFRGKTEYAKMLVNASVEGVNVANNHFIDYQLSGKRSTIKALEKNGIFYSGYGYRDVRDINGIKVGFAGIRETNYKNKPKLLEEDIAFLKKQGCEIIIYSMHFGKEYDRKHNALQEEMAHKAINLGADVVVGNHVHVVQGIEKYKSGLIFYSFGNLVFGGNRDLTEFEGLLAKLKISIDVLNRKIIDVELIPVITTGAIPENDFRPLVAENEHKESVIKNIQYDSKLEIEEKMSFYLSEFPENDYLVE